MADSVINWNVTLAETPGTLELPDSIDTLSALLFNAACLWEAALDAKDNASAPGHAIAREWADNGACACREQVAALAGEVESAWNSLTDDDRDGWAAPFDWAFVPYWLARRLGWMPGDPCSNPHA